MGVVTLDRLCLGTLSSRSPSLCLRRTVFRQNKQPMMKKQIKKARTRESARIKVVLFSFGSGTGNHPAGSVSCSLIPSVTFEVLSRLVLTSSALMGLVGV